MPVVEQILAAERARDRQRVPFREQAQRGHRVAVPAAAADQHQRAGCRREKLARSLDLRARGCRRNRLHPRDIGAERTRGEHVFGERQHDGSRPAGHRHPVGVRDVLGNPLRPVDLGNPFGDAAVHPPIVDLLERLAIGEVAADLPHEHKERRGILRGRVYPDGGIRGTRPAGDDRDSRASRHLAAGFGHVRGAAFLPADDELQAIAHVVERVQHGEKALTRDTERVRRALGNEVGDENLAAGAEQGSRRSAKGASRRQC